jgi:DNA-binding winged helix-turn-helix (wHTH) protein
VPSDPALYFGSFRLDPRARALWQGRRAIRLTPKAYGVLDYLARNSDRIVPKHELLDTVWSEVNVGDAVLKVAIREIRSVLDDDAAAPRFVQTARRRLPLRGIGFVGGARIRSARHSSGPGH